MIPAEDLQCLKAIALRGGCKGPVFVSTQSIGTMLAISQQTASRRLKGLETQGLITRAMTADGQHVTVTSRERRSSGGSTRNIHGSFLKAARPMRSTVPWSPGSARASTT